MAVAKTVSCPVEMVRPGLAVAMPFKVVWNGRGRAKASVASASVAFSHLWASLMSIQREMVFQIFRGLVFTMFVINTED